MSKRKPLRLEDLAISYEQDLPLCTTRFERVVIRLCYRLIEIDSDGKSRAAFTVSTVLTHSDAPMMCHVVYYTELEDAVAAYNERVGLWEDKPLQRECP